MTLELRNVVKNVGAETHIHETSLVLEEGSFNVLLGTTLAGTFGDKAGVVTVLNIQGCVYVLAGIIVPGLLGGARRANVLKLPVRS